MLFTRSSSGAADAAQAVPCTAGSSSTRRRKRAGSIRSRRANSAGACRFDIGVHGSNHPIYTIVYIDEPSRNPNRCIQGRSH